MTAPGTSKIRLAIVAACARGTTAEAKSSWNREDHEDQTHFGFTIHFFRNRNCE